MSEDTMYARMPGLESAFIELAIEMLSDLNGSEAPSVDSVESAMHEAAELHKKLTR